MATARTATATGNPEIDGLLIGSKWTGVLTYSFPDSSSDYIAGYGNGEPTTSFAPVPAAIRQAIDYAVGLIAGYTTLSIQYAGTDGADVMVAQSSAANPTSYAYYPSNNVAGGDVWFGTSYNYAAASLGNYFFATAIHELGHAVGLKHSQETGGVSGVAVPAAQDFLAYSVMSYRSYMNGPLTGYTNEAYGYPQTYMANDILALQTLYGANFASHAENTVYSWSPATGQEFVNGVAQLAPGNGVGGSANRVFMTVWDGNGVDTYDLSNYNTPVRIDLNPGAASVLSQTQLAYLGGGQYANGNVYNSYLVSGDARSYIDNGIGGSGNDTLIGNAIANTLSGGPGNDILTGGGGNDTILGGDGIDTAVFSATRANYAIAYNSATQAFTVSDQRAGSPDGADTLTGVENFQFTDGAVASSSFIIVNHAPILTVPSASVTATTGQVIAAASLFSASDADGDSLVYSITDTNPGGGYLVVNGSLVASATTQVTSAQLAQTSFVLGSAGTSDDLIVSVSDGQISSAPAALHISVLNRAPGNATLSSGIVAENSTNGTVVGTITGSDPDIGTTLHYTLLDDAGGRFVIEAGTGRLILADGLNLNYEAATSHDVVVRIADEGELFIDRAFTIHVTDVAGLTTNGDGGDNTIVGSREADTLSGLGGNDTLIGGAANDVIDGGDGIDTAVFSGNVANYSAVYSSASQIFTVTDQRAGSPDGIDTVGEVEQFRFADAVAVFTTNGNALASQTTSFANGTQNVTVFDTAGNQPWVWSNTNYDAAGNVTTESRLNDDGTHALTLNDVGNRYGWTDATVQFDSAGRILGVTGHSDDGSHTPTMIEIAAAYDTAAWSYTPLNTTLDSLIAAQAAEVRADYLVL